MTTPTRPTVDPAMLERYSDEERQILRAEFEESLDRLEARGPLTMNFGPRECGLVVGYDMATQENIEWAAVGEVVFDTYTDMGGIELHAPDPDVVRGLPAPALERLDISGADDEVFRALMSHPHLTTITISSGAGEGREEEVDDADQDRWISDAAFAELARHPEAVAVRVSGTQAEDATIRTVLEALVGVVDLSLGSEVATFADLSYLEGREIESMILHGQQLRPDALANLPHLPGLAALGLRGTGFGGDFSVAGLAEKLPALELLLLGEAHGGELPVEQTLAVRRALPDVEINYVHYSPKAVERMAKKFGVTLAGAS